jgi:protein-tyrosine phosphatase
MDRIRNNIFIGNSHDAQHEKEALKAAGVTAILNVAWDLTNKTTTHNEFKMCKVGLVDGDGNNPLIATCAVMVLKGLLEDGHTVLVHCHEGKSRSVAVVAALLVLEKECRNFDSAHAEIQRHRQTGLNPNLRKLFSSVTSVCGWIPAGVF